MRKAAEYLQRRVAHWVETRIGKEHMHPCERAMRLLEEAMELAQAEGVTLEQTRKQAEHVYARSAGEPDQEAGGVAVCLLAWCAARERNFGTLALTEIVRIELKPVKEIRGSVARKADADLVLAIPEATP